GARKATYERFNFACPPLRGVLERGCLTGANQTFEAHAIHPSLGNEAARGIIFMDRWTFHFQSEAAGVEIPMTRLQASFGEGEDERIYFSDPAHPEWNIFTTDQSVLENRCLADHSSVCAQL